LTLTGSLISYWLVSKGNERRQDVNKFDFEEEEFAEFGRRVTSWALDPIEFEGDKSGTGERERRRQDVAIPPPVDRPR
jgi:hypothetical protein